MTEKTLTSADAARLIDHTLLKPEATRADVDALNQALQAAHGENLALRRQLGHRAGSEPSATLTDASASALPAQMQRS